MLSLEALSLVPAPIVGADTSTQVACIHTKAHINIKSLKPQKKFHLSMLLFISISDKEVNAILLYFL